MCQLFYIERMVYLRISTLQVPTSRPVAIQPSQIRWTLPIPDQNAVLIGLTISYGILVRELDLFLRRNETDLPIISNRVRHRR